MKFCQGVWTPPDGLFFPKSQRTRVVAPITLTLFLMGMNPPSQSKEHLTRAKCDKHTCSTASDMCRCECSLPFPPVCSNQPIPPPSTYFPGSWPTGGCGDLCSHFEIVICGSVVAEFVRQIYQTRPHFNVSAQYPHQPNMILLWNLSPAPSFHLIGF